MRWNRVLAPSAEPAPFDGVAASYDAAFSDRQLGRWLREMVWREIALLFQPGEHILELNCGTGEDALRLAQHGCRVSATDASREMLAVAQRKAVKAGVDDWIEFSQLELNGTAIEPPAGAPYDGVLSNFGGLNCVEERGELAARLAGWMRSGGYLVLVPMGPSCPWEMLWHLLHGQPRTAFRRWRGGIEANIGNGEHVTVWYPTPRRLRREFAPYFEHVRTVGVGMLLPPSYLDHLVERWPGAFGRVATLDRQVASWPLAPWLSDHYLMLLRRR
jgi:SAM-dependent methyltransferase